MGKCKYVKICKLYSELSDTCNLNPRMYYDGLKSGAGCYRNLEEEEN